MIRIRPAVPQDAPSIAKIHVDSWRSTYKGIIPDAYLASLSYINRESLWTKTTTSPNYGQDEMVFVAEDDNCEIVGFASGGRSRSDDPEFDGELFAIYLVESYQGVGLGRRLLQSVAKWLMSTGHRSLLIWVVSENPARGFYETMGGHLVRKKSVEIGGAAIGGFGYGWLDLESILETV